MNKSNLLEVISSKLTEEGLTITKRNLRKIVNSILVYMSQSLSNNEEVKISNFGTFRKVKRKEKILEQAKFVVFQNTLQSSLE